MSPKKTSKKSASKSKALKPLSRVDVEFSREELEFLRDVFGLGTPVKQNGETVEGNICQLLAEVTHRTPTEEVVWAKIVAACERTGVVIGDSAPNYAVSVQDVPTMYVYKLED
jgi:hypothetical protein